MKIINKLDLTEYNSYRVHSVAETAFFPETIDDVVDIFGKEKPIVIGGGCNVIFSKEYYKQPIMFIRDNYTGIKKEGERLIAKAGTDLKVLSEYALDHSLTGLEYYYDIPGCVGGATIMNAGCQGVSFSDLLEKVTFYDVNEDSISSLSKDELKFEYRGNVLRSMNVVVIETQLLLHEGEKNAIRILMENTKKSRWVKQPRNYPSAGSVFKRPIGHYVGPMITEVGLKGMRRGGAMFSDKHAGFIVNTGNATANDILYLIQIAQNRVLEKYGVELELEQQIV